VEVLAELGRGDREGGGEWGGGAGTPHISNVWSALLCPDRRSPWDLTRQPRRRSASVGVVEPDKENIYYGLLNIT